MSVTIRRATTDRDWRNATAVLHDHAEWVRTAGGVDLRAAQPAFVNELERLPAHYTGAAGALFIAELDDIGVGTIALRVHDDGTAEVKRLYVRPVARGRGIGDELVAAALDAAAELGVDAVWLETIRGSMDAAITVYERHGFEAIVDAGRTLRHIDGLIVMECRPARRAGLPAA